MHGNVVQLANENGKVIKIYEYDSFGNELKPDKNDDNPFRYCGEYYDKETEEIYLRARYYKPSVGRFMTRDSYTGEEDEPLSLHLYTYCQNDGVNSVDPSGHKIKIVAKEKNRKQKILNTLYKLTGNKLKIVKRGKNKGYVTFQKSAFRPPLKYPVSMSLVMSLIHSRKICRIKYNKSEIYHTKINNIQNAENGRGSNVVVNFNDEHYVDTLTSVYNKRKKKYENKIKKIPEYIALGHELIHALVCMDGESVDTRERSNEYKTVGLSKQNYDITENDIRREHGLGQRLKY